MSATAPDSPMPSQSLVQSGLRGLVLGWTWLAALWCAAHFLAQLPAWGWLLAVLLLASMPAWGLWLAFMLRKKILRFQFAPQGRVGRWLSGGWWAACKVMILTWLLLLNCQNT